jgi:hypothetical protein
MDGGYRGGGYDAATLEAPMLGTTISLARGPFALARITHTAIVPLAARQAGRRIAISTGDPIAPDVGEQAMAVAAAAWLEGYLREFPGEISLRTLEILGLPPTTR